MNMIVYFLSQSFLEKRNESYFHLLLFTILSLFIMKKDIKIRYICNLKFFSSKDLFRKRNVGQVESKVIFFLLLFIFFPYPNNENVTIKGKQSYFLHFIFFHYFSFAIQCINIRGLAQHIYQFLTQVLVELYSICCLC